MISLFIDESGQFEKDDTVIIGGILVKHNYPYQLEKLAKKVKNKFIQLYGEDYIKKIHGTDRNLNLREENINQFINSSEFEEILPFYIEKGKLDRKILSNIDDDNTASMLYFNMLNSLVSTLLWYHPSLLKNEREVSIHLASRVAIKTDERKGFNELFGQPFIGDRGDKIYHLNNETSLLIGLNSELQSLSSIYKKNLLPNYPVQVSMQKIKIDNVKSSPHPSMDFMFLADIVCNYVRYRRIGNYKVPFHKKYAFAYDDINEHYKEMYRTYIRQDLPSFLQQWYWYLKRFIGSSFKEQYDSYISLLEIDSIINSTSLEQVLLLAESIIRKKDPANRGIELFLLNFIEKRMDILPLKDQFKYYDLRISVNNHFGVFKENEAYYQKAMSIGEKVGNWELLDQQRMVMNRYGVSCSNLFDFKKALSISEQLIESQLAFHETLATANIVLFNKEMSVERDVTIGKYYSSKAQYLAFLKQEAAYEYFHKAIDYLQDDPINKNITVSYLIHYLAESSRSLQMKDHELINKYFSGNDFQSRIAPFLEAEIQEKHLPFQLYTFVKLYRYRLKDSVNYNRLLQLVQRIVQLQNQELTHPWPLIFFNLGELLESKDKKLSVQLKRKAIKISENKTSDLTIQLVGKMFEIKLNPNESNLNNFIELVESHEIPFLVTYFELEKLKTIECLDEKVEVILAKFTYMYH